jgi:phosphoglycolate phosphatase
VTAFRLLVFDWDGTLMDSEARIVECMCAAAADMGIPVPERAAVRNIIGLGLREASDALFPTLADDALGGLVERYRNHFLGAAHSPSVLFDGARETLLGLEQQGYLLAVATGKGRRGLDEALGATDLAGVFHATRCADETFSKPHPEMLLQVMDELGAAPAETLMIGDTEYDMEMARNAGTAALAVAYGVHGRDRLLTHRPLGCLSCISELGGWLDGVGGAASAKASA